MFRRNFNPANSFFAKSFRNSSSTLLFQSRRFINNTTPSSSSSPASSSPSPSSSPAVYSDDEIKNLVKALEADPELAIRVVSNLSPAARRQLVVAGSAFEWFGGQRAAQSEVTAADYDHDKVISTKDFDKWFEKALQRRRESSNNNSTSADGSSSSTATATTDSSSSSASSSNDNAKKIGLAALVFIGLEAGLPFVGFGFLDNAAMILAGDVIDRTVGMWLGLSVLASAAMGNVVSGMIGMQVHGSIERLVHFFKLPVPHLDDQQRKSRRVFFAGHIGGTIGIATGLTLGMMPLLFLNDKEQAAEIRAFNEIDTNHDCKLQATELKAAMKIAGVEGDVTDEIANNLIAKYGDAKLKVINKEEFHKMCIDLKSKGPLGMSLKKLAEDTSVAKAGAHH
jgi:hypothetical protein